MAPTLMLLFSLFFTHVLAYLHQKPVAEKLWSERCARGSYVLNDCNWCHCDKQHKYTCKARVCSEVDMFGHFNDAIREINVGMEGHGVWRSDETPCEPRVHYRRKSLLCVCGDDGNWPNPVCRDIFQNLHPVEIIDDPDTNHLKCSPNKLHLIGCNICFCSSSGKIDKELCTKNTCNNTDPVVKKDDEDDTGAIEEVYAECDSNSRYKLGCQTCDCLRNNRLICDNCTKENKDSYCNSRAEGEIFNIECNNCKCDSKGLMHCTAKSCLSGPNIKSLRKFLTIPDDDFIESDQPIDDQECEVGTKYKKGCNRCYCFNKDGVKIFACTVKACTINDIHGDCVEGSVYEMNCLICHCVVDGGVKFQVCQLDNRCISDQATKELRSQDLRSLHGYCEPLHVYRKDCNTCRCHADGRSLMCTTKLCDYSPRNPLSVGIIPVIEKIGICPIGHYYKIDCNVCFCLSNGNAICTTGQCRDEY